MTDFGQIIRQVWNWALREMVTGRKGIRMEREAGELVMGFERIVS